LAALLRLRIGQCRQQVIKLDEANNHQQGTKNLKQVQHNWAPSNVEDPQISMDRPS
jgi:hypothetical protein